MVDYYLGHEYRTNRKMRWTHRKTFIAVIAIGVATWAGVLSLAHFLIA